jgi:hypothetical protein
LNGCYVRQPDIDKGCPDFMNEWGHHLYFAYRGDTEGPTNFWGFDEDFDFVQRGAVLKIMHAFNKTHFEFR